MPCLSCTFSEGNEEITGHGQVFAQSSKAAEKVSTTCSVCEVKSKIGKYYRFGTRVDQAQLSGTVLQKAFLQDDDTITFGVATLYTLSVPPPDIQELQVMLE